VSAISLLCDRGTTLTRVFVIPKRFSLKFLLGFMFIAAVCAAVYMHYAPRRLPTTEIECTQPWGDVTKNKKTVLFVDADCNGFTLFWGHLYEPYCRWFRWKYGRNAVLVDTTLGSGETWDVLQQTWRDHNVITGGYKTWGGAGQVVWIRDGIVVDTAFLPDFPDLDSMKQRTLKNFR